MMKIIDILQSIKQSKNKNKEMQEREVFIGRVLNRQFQNNNVIQSIPMFFATVEMMIMMIIEYDDVVDEKKKNRACDA